MRGVALLLILTGTIQAQDEEQSKHLSDRDEMIGKLFTYLFGITAPEEVEHVIKQKLSEDTRLQESVQRISTSSSDSDDEDLSADRSAGALAKEEARRAQEDPDRDVRRMVMLAITEVLKEKHLDMCDARLQLQMREREVRQERYKFYAALLGTITAVVGLGSTILAYNIAS